MTPIVISAYQSNISAATDAGKSACLIACCLLLNALLVPSPLFAADEIKIDHSLPIKPIKSDVSAAYEALNMGDDSTAAYLYGKALQSAPYSVDALLGLAAIALRQGQQNKATSYYAKVLELDPDNSIAEVTMLSLQQNADNVASESRIKNLLAKQPDAAYLYAALGNLEAEQANWPAAQQAYFEAFHLDSNNADYAYNLAISLDQWGKSVLAVEYYKKTLALLANRRTAGLVAIQAAANRIDVSQVQSRIAQLTQ